MGHIVIKTLMYVLFLSIDIGICAQNVKVYGLLDTNSVSEIIINKLYDSNATFTNFGKDISICGLSVNMVVNKKNSDFLVRIVLEDSKGDSYLVAESYKEISDEKNTVFKDYCEETSLLNNITPKILHIYVCNAQVELQSIKVSLAINEDKYISLNEIFKNKYKKIQVQEKVDKINNYNKSTKKLWQAGVTETSLRPFKERMRLIGCPDSIPTGGIEYYVSGIFEFGEFKDTNSQSKKINVYQYATPIEQFDWRNCHGKNWITPVKNQGGSHFCSAYAAVGALEALAQLYYNQIIDTLDLSERDAIIHHEGSFDPYVSGAYTWKVVQYLVDHGVCDEESYPYDNDLFGPTYNYDNPKMIVQASSFDSLYHASDEDIKLALMRKGPLVSGYSYGGLGGHAMTLVGFGTIKENTELWSHEGTSQHEVIPIPSHDWRIGHTFWIFKNSKGNSEPYMYMFFGNKWVDMVGPYVINPPINITTYEDGIITKEYSINDIICEDRDYDGYYFWGVGPKPDSCPDYAQLFSDVDDADPFRGFVGDNCKFENLNPEERDTLYDYGDFGFGTSIHCYNHLADYNGMYREIISDIRFHNGSKLFMREGTHLSLLDPITLYDAHIIMEPYTKLNMEDGSRIKMKKGIVFEVPKGAVLEIKNGSIEISN